MACPQVGLRLAGYLHRRLAIAVVSVVLALVVAAWVIPMALAATNGASTPAPAPSKSAGAWSSTSGHKCP